MVIAMKKKVLLMVLFIGLVVLGIFVKNNAIWPGTQKREMEEISSHPENIQELSDTNGFDISGDLFLGDNQRIYQAFISDDNCIHLSYTIDAGTSWNETIISDMVSEDGNVFVCFTDENTGYILYCSDPGLGLMEKTLYITRDAGKTFSVQDDLSTTISGYPTDMLFISDELGYITVSYHGIDEYIYIFNEKIGWNSMEVEIPIEDYSYVNGIGIDKTENGYLLNLEVVTLDGSVYYSYISSNGLTWTLE